MGESTAPLKKTYDSYIAIALQPRTYGCRNKDDVRRNLDNLTRLIDESMYVCPILGEIKLVSLTEGCLQGMWDEYSDMEQVKYCREVAVTIPGPEIDVLAEKAKEYNIYLAGQAKVVEADIMPDRCFNMGFIISPEGEVILKHRKNALAIIEGMTTPYDIWDVWAEKVGDALEACYPVVKTEIGNLAVSICAETYFPETFRAFSLMGAEVVMRLSWPQPQVMDGCWETINRARAFDNHCYVVAANPGPYFTHPDVDSPVTLFGGQSMIVDYLGQIVRKAGHPNEGYVPAEINLKRLREFRVFSAAPLMQANMRSSLWKQIYERWPEYPKNLHLEKTYLLEERKELQIEVAGKLIEAGILTPPDQ